MAHRTSHPAGTPSGRFWMLAASLVALTVVTSPGFSFAHGRDRSSDDPVPVGGDAVQFDGELTVLHEDRLTGDRYLYVVRTDDGEELSLEGVAPQDFQSGDRVRVKGTRVDKKVHVVAAAGGSVQTLALAPGSNTFGAQKTLLILVNFQDRPTQPYTGDYARTVVFKTTSDFWRENSFGQTWLTGDVVGWYTLPLTSTACDYSEISARAQAAASAAGVVLANYARFIYAFPASACGWWGLGTVGGTPSHAWINGDLQLRVVGHELGHNLGLYHSHALECGTTVLGGACASIDYGDTVDIMGASSGHYNAFQKEYLGWLNYGGSPPITTVEAAGVYTIEPYEIAPGGSPKALKILKAPGSWYYVEFRRPVGFDSFLGGATNVAAGVVIHTGADTNPNLSYLLDMTPSTGSWWDPALAVGQSFSDAGAGVTLTTVWANSTNAGVAVALGPTGTTSCIRTSPTLTASTPRFLSVPAGTTLSYTVTVKNNDSAGCSPSSFTQQVAAPNGWTVSQALALASSLNPGSSASATVSVTSAPSAAPALYAVTLTATNSADSSYSASIAISYKVAALVISVSSSQPSYARPSSVILTANVADGGTPVDATLAITITRPDGVKLQKAPRTWTDGLAQTSLLLGATSPLGIYRVQMVAKRPGSGTVLGSATTSFTLR